MRRNANQVGVLHDWPKLNVRFESGVDIAVLKLAVSEWQAEEGAMMSLRLPQNLSSGFSAESGASGLEQELLAEKAASLGHAGRLIGKRLSALESCPDAAKREALIQAAADAAYSYMIQRELCGLFDHAAIIDHYSIPHEVLARIGACRPT